jgi:hypothetical protein
VQYAAAGERPRTCAGCVHFQDDAHGLEGRLPGMSALSSAHAAVRSADGLCALHGRYLAGSYHCGAHQPRRMRAA